MSNQILGFILVFVLFSGCNQDKSKIEIKMEKHLGGGVSRVESYLQQFKVAVISIDQITLENSPQWSAHDLNPPFPARMAIDKAIAAMPKEIDGKPQAFKLSSVELKFAKLENNVSAIRWYWLVNFECEKKTTVDNHPVVVLMDGELIQPKIETRSQEEEDSGQE